MFKTNLLHIVPTELKRKDFINNNIIIYYKLTHRTLLD